MIEQHKPIEAVRMLMDIIDTDALIIDELTPEECLRSEALSANLAHREALLTILHAMLPN